MICKKCGHEDLTGASFCPKCGEKLEEAATYATPVSAAAPMPKKNTAKIIIIAAVIVALLAGAGVVTYFGFFADDPWFVEGKAADGGADTQNDETAKKCEETVKSCMDAVVEMNLKEAYEYVDGEEEYDFVPESVDDIAENSKNGILENLKKMISQNVSTPSSVTMIAEEIVEMYVSDWLDVRAKAYDEMEYEIESTKKDGDNYICKVKFTCISYAEQDGVADKAGETGINTAEEAYSEIYNTYDNWQEIYGNYFKIAYDTIIEEFEKGIKKVKPKETTLELVLVKDGDEWVIDAEEGDFDKLEELIGIEEWNK